MRKALDGDFLLRSYGGQVEVAAPSQVEAKQSRAK